MKMKNLLAKKVLSLKIKSAEILKNERGDGSDAASIIMKIAIAVIIGGVLLGLLNVAVPELWTLVINKIKSTFSL
jgi:hypothetical protein